jgi:hypothetical protein
VSFALPYYLLLFVINSSQVDISSAKALNVPTRLRLYNNFLCRAIVFLL